MTTPTIICFGEVLWDVLPTGKIAGGAPMNVAYHCNNFALQSRMISRVGADDLGMELIQFLSQKGISTDLIQTDYTFPTGTVAVRLDKKGSPSYEITAPVAWDFIHSNEEMIKAVKDADALLYGSLACRCDRTRKTLITLLDLPILKVLDINLRTPFFTQDLLEMLMTKADVVKMNDEELEVVSDWYGIKGTQNKQMEFVQKHFELQKIVMTRGKNGAACLDKKGLHEHPGFPVVVNDTIGSGDSFFAGFLKKMLNGQDTSTCLKFACAVGAFVATQVGGTPAITEEIIMNFIKEKTNPNA